MKVFVTGATGFVGAHTARALLDAGHEVRLLVRNRAAAEAYFAAHGYRVSDFVVRDMGDKAAVKKGMEGCDAVVHAAAVVDLNAKNAEQTLANNLQGIDSVIGSACELGIPKILYVSSMSTFFVPDASLVLDERSPLASANDPYSKSKQLCEVKVRALQEQGYPIVITYPSGVFGPDDPKMSQSNDAFIKFHNLIVPMTPSGIQYVDVRDVALAHVLLLERELAADRTQERYMLAGHFSPWAELADRLERASGIRIRRVPIPGPVFRFFGSLFDLLRYLFPISLPVSAESTRIVTQSPRYDSSHVQQVTGLRFRDPQQTFADSFAWACEGGYIRRRLPRP